MEGKLVYIHHMGVVGSLDASGNKIIRVGEHTGYWGNPTHMGNYGDGISTKYYRPVCP